MNRAVYITRCSGSAICRKLQNPNSFSLSRRLTLVETEPYTQFMHAPRSRPACAARAADVFRVSAALVTAILLASAGRLGAQAIQRSMYVSVVNDAGVPVPD